MTERQPTYREEKAKAKARRERALASIMREAKKEMDLYMATRSTKGKGTKSRAKASPSNMPLMVDRSVRRPKPSGGSGG